MSSSSSASRATNGVPPPPTPAFNPHPQIPSLKTQDYLFVGLFAVVAFGFMLYCVVLLVEDSYYPFFTVYSVSVSLDESNSTTWKIDFSVKNTKFIHTLEYGGGIGVIIQEATTSKLYPNLIGTTIPPFDQRPKNTTFMSATFTALWPHRPYNYDNAAAGAGLILVDDPIVILASIKFQPNYTLGSGSYVGNYVCGDVKVGFLYNATHGTMLGGSVSCS